MSAYVIDFSEPLKNGFTIAAGGFNGPGGSNANTTLRLYGRGALEWGEAVDEDLVRLSENFASASPPNVSLPGQLWMEITYYYHDTTAAATAGWYYYDLNSVNPNKWTLLNGTGVVATTPPVTPTIGQYYLDTAPTTDVLYGYYSLGRYEPATFVVRSYMTGSGAPNASVYPQTAMRVRDGAAGVWTSPSSTFVSPTAAPPTNPQPGMLWYNLTTGNLNLWTGSAWQEILGPSTTSLSTASGQVDMGSFKIINLATPTVATDAANKSYVDSAVAVAGAGVFVLKAGDTGIGALSMASMTTTGAAVVGTTLNVSGTSTMAVINGTTITGSGTVSGANLSTGGTMTSTSLSVGAGTAQINTTLNMLTHRITNVVDPASAQDAATKAYVDAAVGGGSGTTPVINPSTYKAGDIYILTGPVRIYIASASGTGAPPGGQWRQVYPAVYS